MIEIDVTSEAERLSIRICVAFTKTQKSYLDFFTCSAYGDTPNQREYTNMVHVKTAFSVIGGPPSTEIAVINNNRERALSRRSLRSREGE